MKWGELNVEDRSGMAFIEVLKGVGVEFFKVRLRFKYMTTTNLLNRIFLTIFLGMDLNIRKILLLNITHKQICISIPPHLPMSSLLQFRELLSIPQPSIDHSLKDMSTFSPHNKVLLVLTGVRDTEAAPRNHFIFAFSK